MAVHRLAEETVPTIFYTSLACSREPDRHEMQLELLALFLKCGCPYRHQKPGKKCCWGRSVNATSETLSLFVYHSYFIMHAATLLFYRICRNVTVKVIP